MKPAALIRAFALSVAFAFLAAHLVNMGWDDYAIAHILVPKRSLATIYMHAFDAASRAAASLGLYERGACRLSPQTV